MKNVIGLIALSLFANMASASTVMPPEYYSAEFKITKVSRMCRPNHPNRAVCMMFGSTVEVTAHVGCTDSEIHSSFEVMNTGMDSHIFAVSVIKRDPEANRIRCVAPKVIRKEVSIHSMGPFSLHNVEIGQ